MLYGIVSSYCQPAAATPCACPPGDKLDIKEGPQGLFIPGLRIEPVAGLHDVTSVLQKGKQNRSTFATNMNEHSSRSHLVLTIHLKAHDMQKGWQAHSGHRASLDQVHTLHVCFAPTLPSVAISVPMSVRVCVRTCKFALSTCAMLQAPPGLPRCT